MTTSCRYFLSGTHFPRDFVVEIALGAGEKRPDLLELNLI